MTPSLRANLTATTGAAYACPHAQAHAADRHLLIPCPACRPVAGPQFVLILDAPSAPASATR